MGAETRKWWLLAVALAIGLMALGAGVWLVLNAPRSAGEKVARGPMGPREATTAEEKLIVEALERDHGALRGSSPSRRRPCRAIHRSKAGSTG